MSRSHFLQRLVLEIACEPFSNHFGNNPIGFFRQSVPCFGRCFTHWHAVWKVTLLRLLISDRFSITENILIQFLTQPALRVAGGHGWGPPLKEMWVFINFFRHLKTCLRKGNIKLTCLWSENQRIWLRDAGAESVTGCLSRFSLWPCDAFATCPGCTSHILKKQVKIMHGCRSTTYLHNNPF